MRKKRRISLNIEKWGWLIRIVIVLVTGGSLYYCIDKPLYPVLFLAAIIHIIEGITRKLLVQMKISKESWNKIKKVNFLSLAIPFSLYAHFVMQSWGVFAIISILILGGLVDLIRNWVKLQSVVSFVIGFFALLFSVFTTEIPNVLLLDKNTAEKKAEDGKFFFRGFSSQDQDRIDGVVIRQDPPPRGGILGSNIALVFRAPHVFLDFLPFPVWKTLYYEMGDIPVIKITDYSPGHGDNRKDRIPIKNKKTVSQFTRIYGTFENLPKDNKQLFLRVLIMPSISIHPVIDKIIQRWYVQAHEPYRPGIWFQDKAELKLEYNHGSERDGTWYVDAFFGTPQSTGWSFEILAMITSKNLKRGERYTAKEIEDIQSEFKPAVRQATVAFVKVQREHGD